MTRRPLDAVEANGARALNAARRSLAALAHARELADEIRYLVAGTEAEERAYVLAAFLDTARERVLNELAAKGGGV